MAGVHHAGKGSNGSARRKRGAHRAKPRRQPYAWLGASAVAVGVGMALANGAAVAHADDTDSGSSTASATSESSSDAGSPPAGDASTTPGSDTRDADSSGAENDSGNATAEDAESEDEGVDEVETEDEDEVAEIVVDEVDVDDSQDETLRVSTTSGRDDEAPATEVRVDEQVTEPWEEETAGVITTLVEDSPTAEAATIDPELVQPLAATTSVVNTDATARTTVDTTAAEAPAPITVNSIVTDALTWIGLGPLAANLPIPALPVPSFVEALWLAVRQNMYTWNNQRPVATTTISGRDPVTGVITGRINAVDYEGDPITYIVSTDAAHGTVVVDAEGNFTYTPDPAYALTGGTDSFVVTVDDRIGNPPHTYGILGALGILGPTTTALSLVLVPVLPGNRSPRPGTPPFSYTVNTTTGEVTGTLNVTDPDGDDLDFAAATVIDPAKGTLVIDQETGTWKFTPTPAARLEAWASPGVDNLSFTISVSDGEAPAVLVEVIAPIRPAVHYWVERLDGSEQQSWGNQGLAVGGDGRIYFTTYIVDDRAGELVVLNADGTYSKTIDLSTAVPYEYFTAYDVAIGPDGRVFVSGEAGATLDELNTETGHGVIVVIEPDDDSVSLFVATEAPASALAVNGDGRVFVANWNSDAVTVYNPDGTVAEVIETGSLSAGDDSGIAGLALGRDGLLYLTKPQFGVVKIVRADGTTANILEVDGEPWAIAVGDNGAIFVTDFSDSRVVELDRDGRVVQAVTLGYNASPSDVTIAANGNIYVPYVTPTGGAIAIVSPRPIEQTEPSLSGDPISGQPVVGGVVVGTDVIYQSTTRYDETGNSATTTITVINRDGSIRSVNAPGEPVGALVLVGDAAYQTLQLTDPSTGEQQTGVLVVTPSGGQTFTGFLSGRSAGPIVVGSGNAAFQIVYARDAATGEYTTTVVAITAAGGVTRHTIAGYPGSPAFGTPHGPVKGADGTLYLTTTGTLDGGADPVVTVSILTADGLTSHATPGLAGGPVVIGNDGTVYQTIVDVTLDPDSGDATFTAVVAVLTETGLQALPNSLSGLPVGGPVVAADGTVYQTVVDLGDGTAAPTTTVAVVDESGLTVVVENISGTPTDANGSFIPLVAGPDGLVYLTTYGEFRGGDGQLVTLVAALSSTGLLYGTGAVGQPIGTAVAGDGVAFQTAYNADNDTTYIVVVSAAGNAVHEIDGYPGSPQGGAWEPSSLVPGPDGTVYQVITSQNPLTGDYQTVVAVVTADGISTPAIAGSPGGAVAIGPDGKAYVSVGSFDSVAQTASTQVFVVDSNGFYQYGGQISGNPFGAVVFGPDGAVHQTVINTESNGSTTTALHLVQGAETNHVEGLVVSARTAARTISLAAATSRTTRTVNDAYLQPFFAADPTGRFTYTATIASMRGMTFDFPVLSDQELAALVASSGYTSRGFSRDAQGRLIYKNNYSQDVLVVYGSNPNRPAEGAVLVRPGATVALPAGAEGRAASAMLPGNPNWDSLAYRGVSAVPTTPPKTGAVVTRVTPVHSMKTTDLLSRIPGTHDTVSYEVIKKSNGEKRVVVYISGMTGDLLKDPNSFTEMLGLRNFGQIPSAVNHAINAAVQVHNPAEIMIVGYSKGGMIAQNYAESGAHKNKVTVIVTYASPVFKKTNSRYQAIHINDPMDGTANNGFIKDDSAFRDNVANGRVYLTPDTHYAGNKHDRANYETATKNFEWDPKWQTVKNKIKSFEGELYIGMTTRSF